MAKTSGDTRVSRWRKKDSLVSHDLYYFQGQRVEYKDLDSAGKDRVKKAKASISKALWKKLKGKTTPQVIDNGVKISIGYTSHGVDHFCNDAMLNLSGKYFSPKSMLSVNEILGKANYIPTSHGLSHPRTDGRELWFSYSDSEGRGVYFKVTWNTKMKMYELYSVQDKI